MLEYVSAAYNPAPTTPTSCLSNGAISPESCSDITWKAYLKHSLSEIVQPFFMLVPPTENYVNTGLQTSGVSSKTRQFFLPIASDANLSVLQISRIHSNLSVSSAGVKSACNATGTQPADSPLCAGVVIYSLTLYRI